MTTRSDVDALTDAGRGVVALARRDLDRFWAQFAGRSPELFRDALLEFVPELVRTYGDVAATVAAEWYEETRAAQVGPGFRAVVGGAVDDAAVQGSVRYAAGSLFTDNPAAGLALLSGALQRFVLYSSRDTVARNVARDPSNPRYGRVPSGTHTCAFCSLMASRGFVYYTRRSAGDLGRGVGDDYHDDCDCHVVAEWDADQHHIEGYDPGRLFDMYRAAREAAGTGDPKPILAQMRAMFPDEFTDGLVA